MKLTTQEKRIFNISDEADAFQLFNGVENGLLRFYDMEDCENETFLVTNNFLKRLLMEVAKKRNYNVSGNERYDVDELLKKIIRVPDYMEDMDPLYYKDYDKFDEYFRKNLDGKNAKQMSTFLAHFEEYGMNDGFRSFFADRIPFMLDNLQNLYYEVAEVDKDSFKFFDNPFDVTEETKEMLDDSFFGIWDDIVEEEGIRIQNEPEYESHKKEKKDEITEEKIIDLIKFLNTCPLLIKYRENGMKLTEKYREEADKKKLDEFYLDKEFTKDLRRIMCHDKKKHVYYYHGTTILSDAQSIMEKGLGMMRQDILSTSYPEFNADGVILYTNGFGGEIGRDAVVIIDSPISFGKPKDVVEKMPEGKKIPFCPSGLQGLNGRPEYIVDPKYIVGYIDKVHKKVVFNPRYYDYDRINQEGAETRPKRLGFSAERIAEAIRRFNPRIFEKTNQKDK